MEAQIAAWKLRFGQLQSNSNSSLKGKWQSFSSLTQLCFLGLGATMTNFDQIQTEAFRESGGGSGALHNLGCRALGLPWPTLINFK